MTTNRAEMISLIKEGVACPNGRDPFGDHCESCDYRDSKECDYERLADYLLANGVTIQKWLPVSQPPKNMGTYLVNIRQENDIDGEIINLTLEAWYKTNDLLFHNPKEIGWNLLHEWYELSDRLRPYITHWTYWPSMPMED